MGVVARGCCWQGSQPQPERRLESSVDQGVVVYGARPTDAGPLPGLLIGQDQIPGNIQSAGRQQLEGIGRAQHRRLHEHAAAGVSSNDYSGNPFQMDVNYRGFTASPEIGTPEGLSVFFDGIRVNESFGDVVNWDLIPLNAIERFDLFRARTRCSGSTRWVARSLRIAQWLHLTGFRRESSRGIVAA